MKRVWAVLFSLFLIVLVGCSNKDIESTNSLNSKSPALTTNNVYMTVSGMGFDDGKPYISATIKNISDHNTIIYGEEFSVLQGDKKIEPKKPYGWDSIAHTLKFDSEEQQIFYLDNYAIKANESARIVKEYKIDGYDDVYSMYIDFKIDPVKIEGYALTKKSDVWTHNEMGSMTEKLPEYFLGNDNILYSKVSANSPNVIKEWYELYRLEEFSVTKDDFVGLADGKWHLNGNSIDKIISNNKTALRHIQDNYGNFVYILKQNDGSIYYVKGWAGVDGLYQIALLQADS